MTADVSPRPAPNTPPRPRRSLLTRRWLLTALIMTCVLGVGFGIFEYVVWTMPVDSFTFVEWNDTTGRIMRNIASTNVHEASLLRQQINDHRDMQSGALGSTPFGFADCPILSTLSDHLTFDFRYVFRWRGFLIEQAQVFGMESTQGGEQCGTGAATAGDISYVVSFIPVIPLAAFLLPPTRV